MEINQDDANRLNIANEDIVEISSLRGKNHFERLISEDEHGKWIDPPVRKPVEV
jgi:anaerobic selenocysteine-containing dehydrogenase